MSVAVVVPCFNEADRLDREAFAALIAGVDRTIFVDDGSTDTTAAVLDAIAGETPTDRVTVLRLGRNRGKAEAVRAGLQLAIDGGATVTGYFDADLATPVSELLRMVDLIGGPQGPEVVLASRVGLLGHSIERRPLRHYLGRVYATAASLTLGVTVYDTQCGAKLFRVNPALETALEKRFPDRWSFDVELLARLLVPGGSVPAVRVDDVVEMPLRAWRDVGGSQIRPLGAARAVVALVGVRRRIGRRRPR